MRIAILGTAAAIFFGMSGSAQAAPIQVLLSPEQLTNQPGVDSWAWEFFGSLPSVPANGTLYLEFAFEGGFLRLRDRGGAPDAAQLQYRNDLLSKLALQQESRARLDAGIVQINLQIGEQQAERAVLTGLLQQNQADLVEVTAELEVVKQEVQTLKGIRAGMEQHLSQLQRDLDTILRTIELLGEKVGEIFDRFMAAKDAALDEIAGLLAAMDQTSRQLVAAEERVGAMTGYQSIQAMQIRILENGINTLDGNLALLHEQMSATVSQRALLSAQIMESNGQLTQVPEGVNAEGLRLTLDGPSGNPVPLLGQFLFDVVAGDSVWTMPGFDGVFENGSSQYLAYANITPSYVDLAGFSLRLEFSSPPGEILSLYGLRVELLADEIGIVGQAGIMPVPEPAPLAMFAGSLLGLGWLRRRSRSNGQAAPVPSAVPAACRAAGAD